MNVDDNYRETNDKKFCDRCLKIVKLVVPAVFQTFMMML